MQSKEGGGRAPARTGSVLTGDLAFLEEVILQFMGEGRIVAADPFKNHGGVFHFLMHVVEENFLQL